jgi:hypothetical protein
MTFTADAPVESGRSYHVTEVDGRRPEALSDFAGEARLTLIKGGMTHRIIGEGAATGEGDGGGVRFHQKDPGPDDRDVRVWVITDRGEKTFHAEPFAAF